MYETQLAWHVCQYDPYLQSRYSQGNYDLADDLGEGTVVVGVYLFVMIASWYSVA